MVIDDEFVNEMAVDWYFLSLHHQSRTLLVNDEGSDRLIECGITLKVYLRNGAFTFLEPMNVCVDTETFFDIWLDADGDIQVSNLYTDAD